MSEEKKYLFGPVPSRRLGLSLGVDIVPFKVCSLDCIYCQLGKTTENTIERKDYVPIEPVLAELKEKIAAGLEADYITISGSGEPTLNSRLGEFIREIKKVTDIPVAVITNATLLSDAAVREDCGLADLVVPSLDAADEETFQKINRPACGISIEKLIDGLCEFRKGYSGQMWLEVFLIEGVNTSEESIRHISEAIELIRPDKVQLNTAVRPTAERDVTRIEADKLAAIAGQLGVECEIVADYSRAASGRHIETGGESVLSMLKRRPCSLEDICSGLGTARNEALKYLGHLQGRGTIESEEKGGVVFYKAI